MKMRKIEKGPGLPDIDPHEGRAEAREVNAPLVETEPAVALVQSLKEQAPVRPIAHPFDTRGKDIRELAPDLIDANPYAPREIYTAEMLREMAESIRTKGQREVIHVIEHPEAPGRFMIGDGWTRVLACRDYHAAEKIIAEVHHDLTPHAASWFGYDQNEERNGHTDLDRARFYAKQQQSGGMTQTQIAVRVGRTRQDMTRFFAFLRLPGSVLALVESNAARFGANAAYQLQLACEKGGERKALLIAQRYLENNHTNTWLIDQVAALSETPVPRGPQSQRKLRFANGFYRQSNSTYKLEITVLDPEKRDAFEKGLEALLDDVAKPLVANEQDGKL